MRLLVTTSRLDSYGGSESIVLELVEWFISRGWHVTLLCDNVEDLMHDELTDFESRGKLTLALPGNETPSIESFDLIWITHNAWPQTLLREKINPAARAKIVTLHMGSLEARERAVLPEIENAVADRILVVSGRTRERMIEFGLDRGLMGLFENPVPNSFRGITQKESAGLQSVLFVSNHLPQELAETSRQLKSAGTHVTHLGFGGDRFGRIFPELLAQFDAVVTIGKSTQYCLVMGIPVYSYDHFGGAGWISPENFAFEAFNNFTGYRTNRKLPAEEITSEILTGFEDARLWSEANRATFDHQYSLDRQMEELLQSLTILD